MAETHFSGNISKTPVHSADGYEYGGSTIITFGSVSIELGNRFPVGLDSMIAAAPDLYAALEEAYTSLMIVSEQALDASKTDPRWTGVYEKLTPHVRDARAALKKARGET